MPEDEYANIETLGKYKVLAEIGRGGMARVFKAQNSESGEVVAVKALLPELAGQPAFVKRFRREIETLRVLEHPRIVKILDVGEEGVVQYYAMEYMDGSTVDKQFRVTGRMNVPEALKITRAVAEALQYAHAKGVIHRDIKLANIMTNAGGDVKLADFGIARDVEATRLTVTGGIVGTADYMSPEQAEGKRVTRKSDVYSLGVCLYQMLTGRLPFVGRTYMDVIRAHRFTLPEPPKTLNPSIPARVARLVEMMMEKDPDKRLSSAGDVIALIDAIESTGRELTDEERESAVAMVRWALVADYDWRGVTLRIAAIVLLVGVTVLCVIGFRYRYFTTAEHKYSLAMTQFSLQNYRGAKDYYEDVCHFHRDSELVPSARESIEVCLRKMCESEKKPAADGKAPSTCLPQYWYAVDQLNKGNRNLAVALFTALAKDFPATDGGRMAREKLAELALGSQPAAGNGKPAGGPAAPLPAPNQGTSAPRP